MGTVVADETSRRALSGCAASLEQVGSRRYAIGLRLCGWRPGEAWCAVTQPLGEERETAGDLEGLGVLKRRSRPGCRGGQSASDELAERASVFLMDTRAARRAVIFGVRAHRGARHTACRRCIDDGGDAGQNCLPERGGEDPTAYKSRNASTHSVVSLVVNLAKNLTGICSGPKCTLISSLLILLQHPDA
jgi:hypothetical protein